MPDTDPVTLSEKAARHLRQLLDERGAGGGAGLRISIEKGGCSGLQYVMEIRGAAPGDIIVETAGVRAFVDPESLPALAGCVIDYSDSLSSSGFKIFNPNAVRTCGCGTSFEAQGAQSAGR